MAATMFFQVFAPMLGLNKAAPATMIDDAASPDCRNIRVRFGDVYKRLGYRALGTAMTGTPCLARDFLELDGTRTALVMTTSNVYKYASGWSSIQGGLSGSAAGYHSATHMNNTFIYTNGVDVVKKWTGAGNMASLVGADDYQVSANHKCRAVLSYADRLLLFAPTESGTQVPQRVRWSELGKIEEWDTDQGGGFADLVDNPEGIVGATLLGNYAVAYKPSSIIIGQYVGLPSIFTWHTVVPDIGCSAPRTIKNIGHLNLFMGEHDVYRFDGIGTTPIGKPIRRELFTGMDRADWLRAHATVDWDETLYKLYVPYGGTACNRVYIYNFEDNTWVIDECDDITAAEIMQIGSTFVIDSMSLWASTIDDLQGDTIDGLWESSATLHNILVDSDGVAYEIDGQFMNDDTAAIDAWWMTKDLTLGKDYIDRYKRIQQILFEAEGNTVEVDYSIDQGATWTAAVNQTLTRTWARYKTDVDIRARTIRLRFRNRQSTERFWLRWFGFKFSLGPDR